MPHLFCAKIAENGTKFCDSCCSAGENNRILRLFVESSCRILSNCHGYLPVAVFAMQGLLSIHHGLNLREAVLFMIEMQDVSKEYANGKKALENISVHIGKGEFVYVVGPSGAGKSTFIKLMYREERPSSGHIFVNGFNIERLKNRKIPYLRRSIGVVFQDFKLLPKLTVAENVSYALEVTTAPKRNMRRRVKDALDWVGLTEQADRWPDQLSGGEQQRVAVARALVNNPAVIIADEPTGNLDPENSWSVMKLFQRINDRGTTIVMATHNKEIVNTIRKRVIAIEGGKIIRDEARGMYGYDD